MFNVMANRIAGQGTHPADEFFDQTGMLNYYYRAAA